MVKDSEKKQKLISINENFSSNIELNSYSYSVLVNCGLVRWFEIRKAFLSRDLIVEASFGEWDEFSLFKSLFEAWGFTSEWFMEVDPLWEISLPYWSTVSIEMEKRKSVNRYLYNKWMNIYPQNPRKNALS